MGDRYSKYATGRQAVFAHLLRPKEQNTGMGTKQDDPRSVLAKNLKALMGHGDLNQTALGKKAGVAVSTIGRILAAKHAPDIETLASIAHALGVTTWQIMVPRLDPTNPPVLQNASPEERELYDRLRAAAELLGRKHQ